MSHISQLPILTQLSFVRDAWERERKTRSLKYYGRERESKIEEALICIEALDNIKSTLIRYMEYMEVCNAD